MSNKFNELLDKVDEMSIAMSGDYDFGNLHYIKGGLRVLSKTDTSINKILFSKYNEITNELLYLVKFHTDINVYHYILCRDYIMDDKDNNGNTYQTVNRFQMIAAMQLSNPTMYRGFGNTLYRVVKGVEVAKEERLKGYGTFLYKLLVNDLGFHLMGDMEQYEGARRLWVDLSHNTSFKVDIVDIANGMKVLYSNVRLKDALDERVWTDDKLMLNGSKEERRRGRFSRLIISRID